MKQVIKFKIIIFTAILLFFARSAQAAEIFFEIENPNIQTGVKFEAKTFLDTDNEDINAVKGKIIFPEKLLELKEIKDGNSIINFWVERPVARNGEILFSGIIPGGYIDKKGLVFLLVFQPIQEGHGLIEIKDIEILLNDGKGTIANTVTPDSQLVVSSKTTLSQSETIWKSDIDLPEIFEPVIASDSTMFDGKYFLAFATQDKGSGIDYYEVCEGKRKCIVAESPYLLQNQNLDRKIIVKAVDKSGNERVIVVRLKNALAWYENYIFIAILILMAIAYILQKTLWREHIE